MYVVGEDGLSCALGVRLASDVLRQSLAQPPIDTKGVTKLVPALPRYAQLAARKPVLCIADTDGKCAKELIGGVASSWGAATLDRALGSCRSGELAPRRCR